MGAQDFDLSALSRMFSAGVFADLGQRGRSPLLARLMYQSGVTSGVDESATVGSTFDRAFDVLSRLGNRDDYVYRSAVIQRIVLGRHSLNTATVVHELRAARSKADLVVLNGTATAYEIKSERDSFVRLERQLDDYRRVFASVVVVTSPNNVRSALSASPTDVGVITLSPRCHLRVEREAEVTPERVDPGAVFDTLRTSEALTALESLRLEIPAVSNIRLRSELRTIFESLDPSVVHATMVTTLKTTRSQKNLAELIRSAPASTRTALLAGRLTRDQRNRAVASLDLPIGVALSWS